MDRQRRLKRKRNTKQQKHAAEHPGERLVFGRGTAAVKHVWVPKLPPAVEKGFYITGDEAKPSAPPDQP